MGVDSLASEVHGETSSGEVCSSAQGWTLELYGMTRLPFRETGFSLLTFPWPKWVLVWLKTSGLLHSCFLFLWDCGAVSRFYSHHLRVFRLKLLPIARVSLFPSQKEVRFFFLPFPFPLALGGLSYALPWSNLLQIKGQFFVIFRLDCVLSNGAV